MGSPVNKPLKNSIWTLLFVASAIAWLPRIVAAWDNNSWSLTFIKRGSEGMVLDADLPSPPAEHPRALLWLARAALADRDAQEALSLLRLYPSTSDPDALRVRAAALEAVGNFAGAVEAWRQAGDAVSLGAAAGRATRARRLDDALLAYRLAAEIRPEEGAQPLADFLQWSQRDPLAAQAVLEEALAFFPESTRRPSWLVRLGDVLCAQQQWEQALAAYQQALTADAGLASAHVGLGWVFYDGLNDQTTAEAEFRRAIGVDPRRGDGYAAMGDLLVRQEHYAEAEPWYAQAIERNPGNRWWQYSRANAVRAAGDNASALSLYENTVAKFPDFGEAYFELALLQEASGDLNAAARSMDKALDLMAAPIAWHFDQAGRVYAATGEWSRAADAYRHALALDASDGAASAGLEQVQAVLGDATPAP